MNQGARDENDAIRHRKEAEDRRTIIALLEAILRRLEARNQADGVSEIKRSQG